MNKKKWTIVLIVMLLLGGSVWAFGFRKHPALARMEEIRTQLDAEGLSRDQRRALYREMGQQFEQLPESTQNELRAKRDSEWQARYARHMDEFFAKSPAERRKALDAEIDRDERRAKRSKGGDAGRGGGGGGGGRGGDSLQRRKDFLNRSTPDSRAKMTEHRRQRDERRAQRGLPPRPSRY